MDELIQGTYKQRVNHDNRNHDYSKFAITREECNIVINQNIEKAWLILKGNFSEETTIPSFADILNSQLAKMQSENAVSVLCTCVFYIVDYKMRFSDTSQHMLSDVQAEKDSKLSVSGLKPNMCL